jgi:flagellar basal-body rod protein FlgB
MDFSGIPLFRAMAQRMSWLGERQQVLAQNVANADTPGYVPQDLKAPSFREMVAGNRRATPALAITSPKHLAGGGVQQIAAKMKAPGERTPSGNSVEIEKEMMKVGDTATQHHLVASLYKRHMLMVRAALGRVS